MHDSMIAVSRLSELETVIERGLQTFVDVGMALAEIQRDRLYREGFNTFEDYCRDKWKISRPRAYQLIEAAEVATSVSTIVDKPLPPVANEGQARELAKIKDPETRTQVWHQVNEAAEAAKTAVTAKLIKQAVTTIEKHEEYQTAQSRPELEVIEVQHHGTLSREMPAAPSDEGIWLWGVLDDMGRRSGVHVNEIVAGMTPRMQEEMRVLIPQTVKWLNSYE